MGGFITTTGGNETVLTFVLVLSCVITMIITYCALFFSDIFSASAVHNKPRANL